MPSRHLDGVESPLAFASPWLLQQCGRQGPLSFCNSVELRAPELSRVVKQTAILCEKYPVGTQVSLQDQSIACASLSMESIPLVLHICLCASSSSVIILSKSTERLGLLNQRRLAPILGRLRGDFIARSGAMIAGSVTCLHRPPSRGSRQLLVAYVRVQCDVIASIRNGKPKTPSCGRCGQFATCSWR